MDNRSLVATAILLLLDFICIAGFMNQRYQVMIPTIQKAPMKANLQYAAVAYALMVVGLNMFVLPNIRKGYEMEDSLKYGFTFGVVVYGIFDFTNAAVLKDWDMKLALIDVLWGGTVYFLASYLSTKFVT